MTKQLVAAADSAAERFGLIAPLVGEGLDRGLRSDLMRGIAERSGLSERTLRRYVAAWEAGGFDGLKPKQGWGRPDRGLGESFERVVDAAVELRRESASRSVADIIRILELEGAVPKGSVARSTLQRHLASRGYSSSQMRLYTSKGAAARRFQKEHRCQLLQSDIKFGPFVKDENGRNKQIYLFVWIDDATRYLASARFYLDQTVDSLEDCLRRAVQNIGVPDRVFVDNGGQYRSKWLSRACAVLGIRLLKSRPYHPEGKGKIERFNRTVNSFISEAALMRFTRLAEYNEYLRYWVEELYHKDGHEGVGGISPAAAFGADPRPLRFVHSGLLRDAFLHTEERKVDKTGCVSFQGHLYEVGLAYMGRTVEVRYDPSWTGEIEVAHGQGGPIVAKRLVIGENCGATRGLPEHMRAAEPATSRMLDALKKEYEAGHRPTEVATTFKSFWEGGMGRV